MSRWLRARLGARPRPRTCLVALSVLFVALAGCGGATSVVSTPANANTGATPVIETSEGSPRIAVVDAPTPNHVQLALFVDAGSRDGRAPQLALLAGLVAEARANASAVGAALTVRVTPEATEFTLPCESTADALRACAAVLRSALSTRDAPAAAFAAAHAELRERRQRAASRRGDAAASAAMRALFGDDAAGFFPLGDPATDEAANSAAIAAFYAAHYGPNRALLVAAGDVDLRTMRQVASPLESAPAASAERAERSTRLDDGSRGTVGRVDGAAVALAISTVGQARAIARLARDVAFGGGDVRSAAFAVRGGGVVLLSGTDPADLARLALRASLSVPQGRAPAGQSPALAARVAGEGWAAGADDGDGSGQRRFEADTLGVAAVLAGGRGDERSDDPDAATQQRAERSAASALREARAYVAPSFDDAPGRRRFENGADLIVRRATDGRARVLVVFDGGAGEDPASLHGRTALALGALAENCKAFVGAFGGVTIRPLVRPDRAGLEFVGNADTTDARVADIATHCGLRIAVDDLALDRAKRAALEGFGGPGADLRTRSWVANLLSPGHPGRIAPAGSPERVEAIRLGDVQRRIDALRAGARLSVVVAANGAAERMKARLGPLVAAVDTGDAFAVARDEALGDSPAPASWPSLERARVIIAFRDPVSLRQAGMNAATAGAAHAGALAARLRAAGFVVPWFAGDGSAFGSWSAAAVEIPIAEVDGVAARVDEALGRALVLPETSATTRSVDGAISLDGLRPLPRARRRRSGARFIVARPQPAEALRRSR